MCMRAYGCGRVCVCACVHMGVGVCVCACVHMGVGVCVCMRAYGCGRVYVCVCVCVNLYAREKIFYMFLVVGVNSKVTANQVHEY